MTRNQIEYWKNKETERSNRVREAETQRSNLAQEGLKRQEIGIQAGQLDLSKLSVAEQGRHNLETEAQGRTDLARRESELAETSRTHRANEAIAGGNLAEQRRSNMAQESLKQVDLSINADRNAEIARHNEATEEIQTTQAEAQAEVNKANAELIKIQSEWESLKRSGELELTQKQIAEMDARIDKYGTEIAKMNSDITANRFSNFNNTLRSLTDALTSTSKEVRGWSGKINLVKG